MISFKSTASAPPDEGVDQEALLWSLAGLHRQSLPRSALSALSDRRLVAFYRNVARSERDFIYLLIAGAEVRAGCVLFADVKAALHAHLGLTDKLRLLTGSLSLTGMLRRMRQPRGDLFASDLELAYMFTSPALRGTGLGAQLLSQAMGDIQARMPGQVVTVATEHSPDNRAVDFYLKNNFQRLGTRLQGDKEMLVMTYNQGPN